MCHHLSKYLKNNYKLLKEMSEKITSADTNPKRVNDAHDLLGETTLILYNYKQDKIKQLIEKKQFSYFIARIMINQYHSSSSMFYKTYKKPQYYQEIQWYHDQPDNSEKIIKQKKEIENKLEWVESNLKEIEWFASECFKIYYKDKHSFSSMSKATQISKNTLYKSIRKATDYLKDKLCQKD